LFSAKKATLVAYLDSSCELITKNDSDLFFLLDVIKIDSNNLYLYYGDTFNMIPVEITNRKYTPTIYLDLYNKIMGTWELKININYLTTSYLVLEVYERRKYLCFLKKYVKIIKPLYLLN